MANQKTKTSCFQSKFGGGWISGAQFLAEKMCEKFAESQKQKLPQRFWKDKYWCKKFLLQLKHANDLLKTYNIKHILKALEHPDAKKVYSLGLHSVILPLIKQSIKQESLYSRSVETSSNQVTIDTTEKPRATFSHKGKSSLNKLKDLDDG